MRHVRKEGRMWIISIEAPIGHVWNASDTHEYVAASFYTKPTAHDRDVALKEVLALGTRVCDNPECDWCGAE